MYISLYIRKTTCFGGHWIQVLTFILKPLKFKPAILYKTRSVVATLLYACLAYWEKKVEWNFQIGWAREVNSEWGEWISAIRRSKGVKLSSLSGDSVSLESWGVCSVLFEFLSAYAQKSFIPRVFSKCRNHGQTSAFMEMSVRTENKYKCWIKSAFVAQLQKTSPYRIVCQVAWDIWDYL